MTKLILLTFLIAYALAVFVKVPCPPGYTYLQDKPDLCKKPPLLFSSKDGTTTP